MALEAFLGSENFIAIASFSSACLDCLTSQVIPHRKFGVEIIFTVCTAFYFYMQQSDTATYW